MTLLLLALACGQLPGTFSADPRLDWYTIRTDHFCVHFAARGVPDAETEALARRVGGIAEEVSDRFEDAGVPRPAGPIQLVIADVQDSPNGWAAPLPRNTITIFPVLPAGDRVPFDDWLRTLIIHEYAHVTQMDRARGLVSALRRVFGRIALTAPLAPAWLLEGYAQLWETRLTGYGRLRSTEYEMMLRAAALRDELLPPDRCATYELESWPAGTAPYLYGGMFCAWLADQPVTAGGRPTDDFLSPVAWERYDRERSGLLPFTEELAASRVWGRGFAALWQQWQTVTRARAESARQAISRQPVTPLRRVTNEGWQTSSPCWSGTALLYLSRDGSEYPSIRAVDTATGSTRVLHRARVHGPLSLAPDGRTLAFSRYDIREDGCDRSGVWLLDLADGSARPVLPGRRLRDPDFSPDGRRLACVAIGPDGDALVAVDLERGRLEPLVDPAEPTGFSSPRFSPDGRWLACCVNRPEGRADIELLDIERGWRVAVTDDRANDLSPCWSRDSRRLYFVSDRSGTFNLYAWEVASGRTSRCTNVITGVLEPAVSPDDSVIALLGYSSHGWDVNLLPVRPRDWRPAEPAPPAADAPVPSSTPAPGPVRRYSALPGLVPALWVPFALPADGWRAGALTFGWDPLHFHEYVVFAGWRFTGTPFLQFDYTLARFRPLFHVGADLALAEQDANVGIELPFRTTRRSTWLDFNAAVTHASLVRTTFALGIATSTALRYRLQPAPTEGSAFGLQTLLESRACAGARDRVRFAGYAVRFLEPWPDVSLRLEAGAATALGDRSADSAWALVPGPAVLAVRGWSGSGPSRRSLAVLRTELRVPVWRPERGLGSLPLFLSWVSIAGCLDAGLAWNGLAPAAAEFDSARVGVGVEARAELVLGHLLPVTLTAGIATAALPRPLTAGQLHLEIGSRYLAGLLSGRESRTLARCP